MKKKPIRLTGNETPEERAAINRQIQKLQKEVDRLSQENNRYATPEYGKPKIKKKRQRASETGRMWYSQAQHKVINAMKAAEMSFMEKKIAVILDKYAPGYRHNHLIKKLMIGNRPKLLFYDFFIPAKMMAIEYDGIQHFENKDKEALYKTQDNDRLKDEVSKDRKIKLLRLSSVDIPNMESIIKKFLGY